MAALLIIQATVLHKENYRKYQCAVQPLVQSCGGRLRATGAQLQVLEGSPPGRRLVVFEFPSLHALEAFWRSPQYAAIKPLREGAAQIDVWAVPAS